MAFLAHNLRQLPIIVGKLRQQALETASYNTSRINNASNELTRARWGQKAFLQGWEP